MKAAFVFLVAVLAVGGASAMYADGHDQIKALLDTVVGNINAEDQGQQAHIKNLEAQLAQLKVQLVPIEARFAKATASFKDAQQKLNIAEENLATCITEKAALAKIHSEERRELDGINVKSAQLESLAVTTSEAEDLEQALEMSVVLKSMSGNTKTLESSLKARQSNSDVYSMLQEGRASSEISSVKSMSLNVESGLKREMNLKVAECANLKNIRDAAAVVLAKAKAELEAATAALEAHRALIASKEAVLASAKTIYASNTLLWAQEKEGVAFVKTLLDALVADLQVNARVGRHDVQFDKILSLLNDIEAEELADKKQAEKEASDAKSEEDDSCADAQKKKVIWSTQIKHSDGKDAVFKTKTTVKITKTEECTTLDNEDERSRLKKLIALGYQMTQVGDGAVNGHPTWEAAKKALLIFESAVGKCWEEEQKAIDEQDFAEQEAIESQDLEDKRKKEYTDAQTKCDEAKAERIEADKKSAEENSDYAKNGKNYAIIRAKIIEMKAYNGPAALPSV
jgi:hypothetical protein